MRSVKTRYSSLGVLLLALLIPLCVTAADEESGKPASPPDVLSGKALVEALRAGGYIIYFRHGMTDHATLDTDRVNLADCSKQRLLSAAGRQQMREVGRAFTRLGIRVGTVLSSPYCRTIDTATLVAGRTEVAEDMKHTVNADEATANQRAQALRKLLATKPQPGTNTVLAGHTANLQEATGIWPKPEGVAIVFQPTADGGARYIATVPAEQWSRLAQSK
jgi:phosphohistidine phosphatase SixA